MLNGVFQIPFGPRGHAEEQLHAKSSFVVGSSSSFAHYLTSEEASETRETTSSAARACFYIFDNRPAGILRPSQSGDCDKKKMKKKTTRACKPSEFTRKKNESSTFREE